jgi:NADH dehydrogenase
MQMANTSMPHVVVVGAGFGGLTAARALARRPVRITVIDRTNHHTFQPLLYQVATAGLSSPDIAAPVREILGRHRNISVLMAEVTGFDLERRLVMMGEETLAYDYLVLATGATHAYFGHDDWEPYAPGLKTIEDAVEIRRRILLAFELAERHAAEGAPTEPLNFVVVGGGPTGVELAGTLTEITRHALVHEFRRLDPASAHVILLEGGPRVLAAFPDDLSHSALEQLNTLGVEVRTSTIVTRVEAGAVYAGQTRIPATVVLWAAGVAASPLGAKLGAPLDRAGRVMVGPDLTVPGRPEVFVVGDLATVADEHGKPVPGLAPVAMQEGRYVARTIMRDLESQPRAPFHYHDKGTLATIGRAAAVADFGKIHISGFFAWLAWLFIHIFFLIGFRNRLLVFIQWAWSYFTYERSARLIIGDTTLPGWPPPPDR